MVISVNNDTNSNGILDITRVSTINRDGQPEQISGHKINASGICRVTGSHISCQGSGFDTIEYQEFSEKSLPVLFEGTPSGEKGNIHWNGYDQTIETYRTDADQFYVDLPCVFRWSNQSLMRKLELILLFICNVVFIFTLLLLLALFAAKIKDIRTSFLNNKRLVFFSFLLIDLDNTSHDNGKNLQVWQKPPFI